MQGVINWKTVLTHGCDIIRGWGFCFYLHCLICVMKGKKTTFVQEMWNYN